MRVMAQQRRSGQTSLGRCHPSRDWREPAMWGSGRGTAGAKALRWEAGHPGLTYPTIAALILAIVHQCPVYPHRAEVIECWNWEKLNDDPNL